VKGRLKGRFLGQKPQVSATSASGVWTLDEQRFFVSLGAWPDYRQGQVYEFSTGDSGTINLGSGELTETLRYSGSGVTTSRVVNLSGTTGGGVIVADGSGPIILSRDFTAYGAGSKTLTLSGTNTGNNQVAAIVDPLHSSGRTSLAKTGTGTWVLSKDSTYTGTNRILSGTIIAARDALYDGNGAFGYANNGFNFDGSFMQVGEEGGGAVALILAPGYKFSRYIQVPSGTKPVVFGGGNNSQFRQEFVALLDRDVVLQAATGGKVYFGGYLNDATGYTAATTNFVIGSPGNEGTVVIRRPLNQIDSAFITSGSVTVSHGTLHISKQSDGPFGFGGWINASQVAIDGSTAELNYSADWPYPLEAPLTINSGLLYGTGTISAVGGVAVGAGATISPGDPVGQQTYTTGVTLAPGGTYLWCIDDWTGAGYGKLDVTGGLSITATSSNKAKVLIMGLGQTISWTSVLSISFNGLVPSTSEAGVSVSLLGYAHLDIGFPARYSGDGSLLLGAGGRAYVSSTRSLDFGTGDYEISLRVNPIDWGSYNTIFSFGDLNIGYREGDGWGVDTGSTSIRSDSEITTGEWHLIVVRRVDGVVKIYLDGVEKGSGSDSTSYSGEFSPRVGSLSGSGFIGWIDSINISSGKMVPTIAPVANFSNSSDTSFTIATCDEITGFDASKFEINDALFSPNNSLGGGSWSLSQSGNGLILNFTHA
jgi:autotransporter-associated beta strand protein